MTIRRVLDAMTKRKGSGVLIDLLSWMNAYIPLKLFCEFLFISFIILFLINKHVTISLLLDGYRNWAHLSILLPFSRPILPSST